MRPEVLAAYQIAAALCIGGAVASGIGAIIKAGGTLAVISGMLVFFGTYLFSIMGHL